MEINPLIQGIKLNARLGTGGKSSFCTFIFEIYFTDSVNADVKTTVLLIWQRIDFVLSFESLSQLHVQSAQLSSQLFKLSDTSCVADC